MNIELIETRPDAPDGLALIDALSDRLKFITGDDGRKNFRPETAQESETVFVIAYVDGIAVGCGAIRPLDTAGKPQVCEIKRMYAHLAGKGIGAKILRYLEQKAVILGYSEAWLETRRVNAAAVAFYLRHGYTERQNYGAYIGRAEAVCFEKKLLLSS